MIKHRLNLVNKILPVNCEAYLNSKGWIVTALLGEDAAKIFGKANDNGRFYEVLLPLKTTFIDFNNRILNLLLALQDFEERELEYIANDIIQSQYDVFRIVAFKGDTTSSLPLEDASILVENSLTMMATSAQSILSPQPYFSSRRPKQVNDFLSKLRMGHTERGSFVLTLHTPVSPVMTIPEILEPVENEQFERQVTIQLCSLISEAIEIVNDPKSLTIAHGMNANFIESLATIAGICGDNGTSLNMTWASVRPITKLNIPSSFEIKSEAIDSLKEAGRTLRSVPIQNVEIAGFITRLQRETDEEIGKVKLHDVTTSVQGIITVDLASKNYDKAVDAHKEGSIVIIRGDLQKNSRSQMITNVSEFRVEDADIYFKQQQN